MSKKMGISKQIEVDIDNGYGQYVSLDDSFESCEEENPYKRKITKIEKNDENYDEFNYYLTECEDDNELCTPSRNVIDRNSNLTEPSKLLITSNPLICIVHHIMRWMNE
jgi:hypothetical protein